MLEALRPAASPMQSEVWIRQGGNEFQPGIMLPQAQNNFGGDQIRPFCHAGDKRCKLPVDGFFDFSFQQHCQLFFRNF